MRVAVVGAGIFGVTVALKASKAHDVDLYDASYQILAAASRTNQLRLHRGYHYPRSGETTTELLNSISSFEQEFADATVDGFTHYYSIAREDSHMSPQGYLDFCDEHALEYEIVDDLPYVSRDTIALTIKVREDLLDYAALYKICERRISKSSIRLLLSRPFSQKLIDQYDAVINCTYANTNLLLPEAERRQYKFQVCEKIVVRMPGETKDMSIVVLDGPFMCVDPYGLTGKSLLGNVVHAIHASNVGTYPKIPEELRPALNQGELKSPPATNFDKFIEHGMQYLPALAQAEYLCSMFTVRTVLADVESTDKRPTLINKVGDKIINVFSGKIDTCVTAAAECVKILEEEIAG